MTSVEVYRRNGVPCGIKASGHSGYADSGQDIVCAAISVLLQTLEIGLTEQLGIIPKTRVDAEKALIELRWVPARREAVSVLAESIFTALRQTARAYSNHVKYAEVSL